MTIALAVITAALVVASILVIAIRMDREEYRRHMAEQRQEQEGWEQFKNFWRD
jgi:hypothetical protein